MKRLCVRLVLALALLAPTATLITEMATAPAAHAADYAWSQSDCRPDVWWYGEPGQGAWYWTAAYDYQWVEGGWDYYYGRWGYECGLLGPPTSHWFVYSDGWWRQNFEGGYMLHSAMGYWFVCDPSQCYWA